jgi:exonuclease III
LGADVVWTFGERSGRYVSESGSREIRHPALGLISAPTVTSPTFEIALRRDAEPTGRALFPGDTLRIALVDQQSNGDALPDADGGLTYRLTSAEDVSAPAPADLERADGTAMRVMSYNVEFDGLFESENESQFRRIFAATQPDVISLQEIYDHDAADTQERMTELAPLADGGTWHTAKAGRDLIAASRYPIRETYTIDGYQDYTSAGFVIDAQEAIGSPMLLIAAHPPCCSGGTPPADVRRQQVADGIVAFIRDAQTEGGTLDLPANTPIVIAGDMNFVGDDQQPETLRTGEIINTDTYGASIDPDWDGSPLTDAAPRVTGWPMNFTWYDLGSSFGPGRLDYIYFTDSVLESLHSYVLFTPGLSAEERSAAGLQEQDAVEAADHLPVVVDFAGRE